MQRVILKEAQAPYQVALSDALFSGEVVILEKNGGIISTRTHHINRHAVRRHHHWKHKNYRISSPLLP